MRNLLVGGSGFIGSALARALLQGNDAVISLSHSGAGDPSGVESVEVDLNQSPCPPELLERVDNVFILIGQSHSSFDPQKELSILKDLLKPLQKGKQRVFYFSSSFVYGNKRKRATEQTSCEPIGAYAQFKLDAELLARQIILPERLTILRLANIYGAPGNRGVIGILLGNILAGKPEIELNGDGEQQRDYLFLDDLIAAVIAIKDNPKAAGIINVATGQSHSLTELVMLIGTVSGTDITVKIKNNDMTGVEPQDLLIDNSLLKSDYHFTQFTPLEVGLAKTLERYGIPNKTYDKN